MTRSLFNRGAMVIRSLLRDGLLADHVVMPEGERSIVASEVVAELEAADEAGNPVPVRDVGLHVAAVRAAVLPDAVAAEVTTPDHLTQVRRGADTGDRVASLAGKYGNFRLDDLFNIDPVQDAETFCADIRSMAASLRRQNER